MSAFIIHLKSDWEAQFKNYGIGVRKTRLKKKGSMSRRHVVVPNFHRLVFLTQHKRDFEERFRNPPANKKWFFEGYKQPGAHPDCGNLNIGYTELYGKKKQSALSPLLKLFPGAGNAAAVAGAVTNKTLYYAISLTTNSVIDFQISEELNSAGEGIKVHTPSCGYPRFHSRTQKPVYTNEELANIAGTFYSSSPYRNARDYATIAKDVASEVIGVVRGD